MKKLMTFALVGAAAVCVGCGKDDVPQPEPEEFVGIEGLSMENYPRVDGATATWALNRMIACKLLGVDYVWSESIGGGERVVLADYEQFENWDEYSAFDDFLRERIPNSRTHGAFMNLVDGEADIIVVSSRPSPEEKAHADEAGVTLVETPIALDAFVFIVNEA
ncbi:MAG: hypothetical protein LBU98_05815, partial [Alistipes sp.]|nr:hypothetical protein [Alistipes sp.]